MAAEVDAPEAEARLAQKYEVWDPMDQGYRDAAARLASFQTLAELVGVLPFSEWIDRVPDATRKQMLIAKVQDEVGHGHVMARVSEDLGTSREQILWDFVEGRAKIINVFHYGFETWEEVGPAALLLNSAAIVQFQSLHHGTYLPYARALRKIEKEESFHYHHAIDLTHELMTLGTPRQRDLVQQAFATWLPRLIAYFGPSDAQQIAHNPMYVFGLKVDANDVLRQRWLAKIMPVCQSLGLVVDPAVARYDQDSDTWVHQPPDWQEVKRLGREGGPRYQQWVDAIRGSLERNRPFREAALRGAP